MHSAGPKQDDASATAAGKTFWHRLFAPIAIDFLVYFRIVFGGMMFYWATKYLVHGLVEEYYVEPRQHFHYYGFGWVRPWPDPWMRWHFYVLGLAAAGITLGLMYRVAAAVFALGFTYVFLLDKTLYQNHYYLVALVSWLMLLLPAHRALSVDAAWRPQIRASMAPAWTLWLVRFQVAIPYFFGGIAKLNADWLAGQPMRTMLAERTWYPGLGQFFTDEWCVQLFIWGGLLFDLLVVPALLWRPTRMFAYAAAFLFHLLNATLFTIGIFPWFMILATVVFFSPDSIRKLLQSRSTNGATTPGFTLQRTRGERNQRNIWDNGSTRADTDHPKLSRRRKIFLSLLATYVVVQLVVPLRHFAQQGHPSWTEEGHYFSWHMLLRGKRPAVRFIATDPKTRREGTIDLRGYVTPYQMQRLGRDPRMLHQLAQTIAADLRAMGFPQVEIRVLALVSLNGRKPQLMIDPTVNLAAEPITWKQPHWIVPLTEPLRDPPWDLPLGEWEQHVEIPARYRRAP